MPQSEVVTYAIALGREPRGEAYAAYRLLSAEQGVIYGLVRRSSKPGREPSVDLFDEGEFRIEIKAGSRSGFIKDVHISRKRTQLAKRYDSFQSASRLANILLLNPTHEENLPAIFELLEKGLDAWEAGRNAYATYLKCLYVYCRKEGYPLKEQWAPAMNQRDAQIVTHVINRSLQEINTSDDDLKRCIDSLEGYLRIHTHIRIDP